MNIELRSCSLIWSCQTWCNYIDSRNLLLWQVLDRFIPVVPLWTIFFTSPSLQYMIFDSKRMVCFKFSDQIIWFWLKLAEFVEMTIYMYTPMLWLSFPYSMKCLLITKVYYIQNLISGMLINTLICWKVFLWIDFFVSLNIKHDFSNTCILRSEVFNVCKYLIKFEEPLKRRICIEWFSDDFFISLFYKHMPTRGRVFYSRFTLALCWSS